MSMVRQWGMLAVTCAASLEAQRWTPQASSTMAELRGLHVVSDAVVWASGQFGTVVRTVNGGATWTADTVPGAAGLDFRDIHAIDERTAWVLAAGSGDKSRIYRTTDGGATWTLQFTNPRPQGFYDCLDFWDETHGIAMSDPVDGKFVILRTDDGVTWTELSRDGMPAALEGEGAFAASGSCLVTRGENDVYFVTGGVKTPRVFRSRDRGMTWTVSTPPIAGGAAARGIFSIAVEGTRVVVTGGDYTQPARDTATAAVSTDGGATWKPAARSPHGYRSAVAFLPLTKGERLVAVGLNGSDASMDGGRNWFTVDGGAFNSVAFFDSQNGWAVGPKGVIAKWEGRRIQKDVRH